MLCGIDEAGRGCLAGPLVVAGCVLTEPIEGLNDSKQLSEKKRETLFPLIKEKAAFKIVQFEHDEVDNLGLSVCLGRAIKAIKEHFKECDILMDGNSTFGVSGVETMVKADAKVPEVSAASILAKVTRDHYMLEMDKLYPAYGFAGHKGYGSALHVKKIEELGPSPIQRMSFKIKSLRQPSLF